MRTLLSLLLAVLLATSAPAARADPDPAGDGVWPLVPEPAVVRHFEPPSTPFGPGHRGVDLAGSPGQLVLAALPGRVAFSGRVAGRSVVVVRHGQTRTTYEPVAGLQSVGSVVAAGDPIGRLELAGSHCFPAACLHWGWRRGESYLDPLELVGGGPVRLLPLYAPAATARQPGPSGSLVLPYAAWRPLLALVRLVDGLAGRPSAAGPS